MLAARAVDDARGHAICVLLEAHQFMMKASGPGRARIEHATQQRFELDLRQIGGAIRAIGGVARPERPTPVAIEITDLAPVERAVTTERCTERDPPHVLEAGAFGVHLLGQPVLAEDLHRALIEDVRARQIGRARIALHQQRAHAQIVQENSEREPTAAATNNEDRNIVHAPTLARGQ